MTDQEYNQVAEIDAEVSDILKTLKRVTDYYLDNKKVPSIEGADNYIKASLQLKKLSLKLAWLTAPAFMKEL